MKIKKKTLYILIIVGVLMGTGTILGLNGYFGGGSSIPADTMSRGLVGYWNFDEGTGQTAYDSSGNANNGTLGAAATAGTDDPQWTSQGKVNGASSFDGVDDYVNCGNNASLAPTTNRITIETWVYQTLNSARQYAVGKWAGSAGSFGFGVENNNKVKFRMIFGTAGDTNRAIYTLPFAGWYHLVGVYDGSNMITYVNAVVQDTYSVPNDTLGNDGANLYIGAEAPGINLYKGLIDEVRIYNRALSAEEIRFHYNRGGPVAHWKLDEGTGSIAYDSTDNNNDGTLYGGMATATSQSSGWKSGKYGPALAFDGVDDYVDVGDNSSFQFERTNNFTFSVWIKTSDTSWNPIIQKANGSSPYTGYWFRQDNGNRLELQIYDAGPDANYIGKQSVATINDNQWHHVVAAYDGSSVSAGIKLYIDGSQAPDTIDQNVSSLDSSITYSVSAKIGGDTTGTYFNGLIDDVRIYNYVRTPDEIALDYNAGFAARFGPQSSCDDDPGSCMTKGLLGYWSFDEGTGQTAYDGSGNANNGTLGTSTASGTDDPAWTQKGAPCFTGATCGGGLSFDGNDYVDTNLTINTSQNVTIEGWAYVTDKGESDECLVGSGYGGSDAINFNLGLTYYYDGRYFWSWANATKNNVDADAITNNTWFHWALIADNGTAYYYINGAVVDSMTYTGGGTTRSIFIGARRHQNDPYNAIQTWHGAIDEVRVYNRVLSAEEIRYHYSRGAPVAYWKFDEGSGSTAYDNSNNNNDGTLYGGMATATSQTSGWKSGKYGTALSFDGTDDYVGAGSGTSLNIGTSPATIEAWVKTSYTADTQTIIGTRNYNTDGWVLQIYAPNEINFGVVNGGQYWMNSTGTNIVDGVWHYIVVVRNGTANNAIYVDGVSQTLTSNTENLNNPGSTLSTKIGKQYGAGTWIRYFNGLIDDVRIYNYARTASQILQDYNAGFAARFGPSSSCEDDPGSCMTKGLVGYWLMDEGTGQTAYDSSGNANNGTLGAAATAGTDDPQWATQGKVGGALQFDGTNDYVDIPEVSLSQFAYEAWIYSTDVAGEHYIIGYGASGLGVRYSNVYFWCTGQSCPGSWFGGTATLNNNTWYHFVATYDGTTIKLYLNGQYENSNTASAAPSGNLFIGRYGDSASGYYSGLIDDIRIYNRALSAEEIRYHYNRGGPVAHWKMNEGQGTTTYDATDNNNDGTVSGASWVAGKYGSALKFDGTDDYINVGNSSTLGGVTALTIEAWIKPNSLHTGRILERGAAGNENRILLQTVSDGTMALTINDTDGITGGSYAPGNWYHLVATWAGSGGTKAIYVNGVMAKSGISSQTTVTAGSISTNIGQSPWYALQKYDGLIDDVRFYNYTRTPVQILQDYNMGLSTHFK